MALLSIEGRKKRFEALGLGDYTKDNILKFQKKAFKDKKQHDGLYGPQTDNALRTFYNCSLVKNFKPEEFRCSCGHCSGYPSFMKQVELQHLQRIRDHYGKPMDITSGLRCSYENNRVGGVPGSSHLTGYAADFHIKGVTETPEQRKDALKWIKEQPNHQFTYGAYIVDTEGKYWSSGSMGNAMHTETHKPSKAENKTKTSFQNDVLAACKAQAEWMKNYVYGWEGDPTVEKSKKKGTCVTYIACVLQRLKYLASGKYIWHTTSGKVYGTTDRMTVIYPKNRTLKDLKDELQAYDIVMAGDAKSVEAGGSSHIFMLTGKWKGSDPYIWDNHSCERVRKGKSGAHTYSGSKKVIAIVRLKKPTSYYSDTTKIGEARCNEMGTLYGGQPGDQTGKEVGIGNWYSGGWLYMFRAKDETVRTKLAQAMIDTCNNANIGYNASPPNRYAAWDNAEANKHDIKGISKKGDTTCSQAVSMCIRAAGIPKAYAPRHCDIAALTEVMKKSPHFTKYTDKKYTAKGTNLLPGDILLSSHHTVIVVKSPKAK